MLYVTQNFYRPSVSIKTTYKIKLLWVLKNWKFLLALSQFQYLTLVHDFNIIRTMLLTSTTWTVNPYLVNVLFNNIEHFVFKKHLKSPKTFWKINFDKSLKFNILKNVINDNQNNVKHDLHVTRNEKPTFPFFGIWGRSFLEVIVNFNPWGWKFGGRLREIWGWKFGGGSLVEVWWK